MTKSKTSTIAIVVLSVLLAAALAATIVLAAFTATGRASTTITFGEGLTVTLSGDDVQTAGNTVELTPKSGLTDTGDIYSNALTATPSRTAHIAYKPAITVSEGFTAGAATNGTNAVTWTITKGSDTITLTMAYTGATWNTESSCLTIENVATTGAALYNTISISTANKNALAGLQINFSIELGAVSADGNISEAIALI